MNSLLHRDENCQGTDYSASEYGLVIVNGVILSLYIQAIIWQSIIHAPAFVHNINARNRPVKTLCGKRTELYMHDEMQDVSRYIQ